MVSTAAVAGDLAPVEEQAADLLQLALMIAIPAIGDEPPHEHIDIRFLVEIDDSHDVPGNDESHEVTWVDLYKVSRFNNNRSTYRMVEKTRLLRNLHADRKIA